LDLSVEPGIWRSTSVIISIIQPGDSARLMGRTRPGRKRLRQRLVDILDAVRVEAAMAKRQDRERSGSV
jgi:hypothetical protein